MEPEARGYRRAAGPLDAVLASVREADSPVQLLRADRVFGRDHLLLAARLAQRALVQGRARSGDVATETLLYAGGERQIGRALAFLGLDATTPTVAALAWGERGGAQLDRLAAAFGWTRDDEVLAGGPHVLDAFGIGEAERAWLPPHRWDELVLERVALLDVAKA